MARVCRSAAVAFAAVVVFIAGCESKHSVTVNGTKDAQFVSRDSARKLGPGDVQIASTDSALEVGIYGDSLLMGLGQKVRDKIAEKTDTTQDVGNGLGASISRLVKGTVAKALAHQLEFPISNISDIRYTDEHRLEFYDASGKKMHVFEGSSDDRKSATFAPDDAQRLIAAFKARKGGRV